MKNFVTVSFLFFILVVLAGSCTSANKEQLIPDNCKVDSSLSYSKDIQPIFEINCYGCHGQNSNETSGGINLEDTTTLNKYIKNNQLLNNINHTSNNPMPPPPAPKLSDCEISQITYWINVLGAPKNN
jgi:mono/diheme cytochrome c family protein